MERNEDASRVIRKNKTKMRFNLDLHFQVPSVIQVRLKGCKGVLALNPAVGAGVSVRPSMEKFPWNAELFPAPYPLGITDSGAAMSRSGHKKTPKHTGNKCSSSLVHFACLKCGTRIVRNNSQAQRDIPVQCRTVAAKVFLHKLFRIVSV